jgi:3-oxoadipate enol-lactonase
MKLLPISVTVRGEAFAAVDAGDGPPVLLVHGFPLDHTMWSAQLEELRRDHRVIAPDLRGFGGSVVSDGAVEMGRHAEDLADLLDALGVREPVVLCGLSMGGYVAFAFVQRHARRLAGLVLCDTKATADDAAAAEGRLQMAERVLADGNASVAEAMLPKLLGPETLASRPGVVAAVRRMILSAPPRGIAAAQRGMARRPDVTALLARIAVPTLAIVGEHDAIAPPATMRALAAAIPGSRFVQVAGAGHIAPMESPDAVNAALREFLR